MPAKLLRSVQRSRGRERGWHKPETCNASGLVIITTTKKPARTCQLAFLEPI